MRSRTTVFWQVFSAVLAVALGAVAMLYAVVRYTLAAAFDAYLQRTPSGLNAMGRPRMGRALLGAAEQTFLATVDASLLAGALFALGLSVLAAWFIASRLTRPVRDLEHAAHALAGGDLSSRVEPSGPAEVASLGDAFNRMADSLEQAEDLRRRLVADVAHELRNPIAAARAQAEGMAEGVLAPSPERLMSLVDDMTHLSALVNDLQELAVAEAGRLAYDMQRFDISTLAGQEAQRASRASGPRIAVVTKLAGDLFVEGDERRLSEVMRNLLTNAVRHTPQGTVTVEAHRAGDWIEVLVADTGQGIPAEDLPYVFERFYRADSARAADTGGAGLGLAISRRIVEDHGGEVYARSEHGEGATVGFRLPAAP